MRLFVFSLLMAWSLTSLSQKFQYPQDVLGVWKGDLVIEPSGMKIPMSLQLGPAIHGDSVFHYILTYSPPSGNEDRREYELLVKNREKGFFEIDEKNSIRLSEKVLGNKVISLFEVSGSSLMITLEMQEDRLIFEVFSWASDKKTESGGEGEIPKVYNYSVGGYQKAVLRK